ncbi:MAG TPA: hypothetical protein VGR05_03865 [Sphingomicrobium sp.]|nr:hypothetical protein [Sphingomicrobium sp.]
MMPDLPHNGDGRNLHLPPAATSPSESAALLLAESLIHGLIARSILSVDDAIEIIEIAADVEREPTLSPSNGKLVPVQQSLLMPMADSLRYDRDD